MRTLRFLPAILGALLLLGDFAPLVASGTYRPSLVRGNNRGKIDTTKYIAGKKIFLGSTQLTPRPQATDEVAPRLAALQKALPDALARSKNLNDLAGKITTLQMDSLEYYFAVRFRIILPKKP